MWRRPIWSRLTCKYCAKPLSENRTRKGNPNELVCTPSHGTVAARNRFAGARLGGAWVVAEQSSALALDFVAVDFLFFASDAVREISANQNSLAARCATGGKVKSCDDACDK